MEVTDALKQYAESGLDKLRSHFDNLLQADVVLEVQKLRHICEITLNVNGLRVHGKEATQDMYASMDAVLAKLEKQVRKYKDRIKRHQPRTIREARQYHHHIISFSDNGRAEVEADFSFEEEPETMASAGDTIVAHRVVHREQLDMKPMSLDEAVMQLELIDDPFLVFSNAGTSRVNVLYARDDGTFGLIEPQF